MNVFNRGADIITWKRVQDKSQKKLWSGSIILTKHVWTVKIFHLKGKNYPDDLETFHTIWKLSVNSRMYRDFQYITS